MAAGAPDFYHRPFSVTIAAGTAKAAPASVNISPGLQVLHEVSVRIPPGPNGQAGFQILWTSVPLVPWGDSQQWIVGNDEKLSFPIGLEVDSGVIFRAYNTDVYDHTFYVLLTTSDVVRSGAGVVAPIPLVNIETAAGRIAR